MMRAFAKIVILVLAFPVMLTVLAATAANPPAEPGPGVTVVVEVFSGRPNPSFVLDDATELGRLRQAFSRSPVEPPDGERAADFGRLGYRGIVILNEHGMAGVPRYVQALDGLVLSRDGSGGPPLYFRDTELLERRCLALARERGLLDELIEAGLVPDPSAM